MTEMNDIDLVSESVIKIEQVKEEQVEYLEDHTWDSIEQGEASTLMCDLKEEKDEEELKPPVRLFLNHTEVSEEEIKQEEEDPLGMCYENVYFKSPWFVGEECGAAGAFSDSMPGERSAGEKCHGVGNSSFCGQENTPAPVDGGNPNYTAVCEQHSAENASLFARPSTSRHVGEQPFVKSMPESGCEVRVMPKGESCNECSICQKGFKQSDNLARHIREIHRIERPHECSICRKFFKRKRYLFAHMRTHGDGRAHECSVCRKSFALRSYLAAHVRTHSRERPYECSICRKRFKQRFSLEVHKRIHSGEHRYECSVCQKSFTHRSNLVVHMRRHSGERSHECSVCRKSFTVRYSLVVHMRIHSSGHLYECSVCQKGFRHRSSLVRHMRIHSGERPHKCSVCQKNFVQKVHLVNHMRRHRDEQPQ